MFKGMQDSEWELLRSVLPRREKRTAGMSPADFRCVLNAILWIAITGARWRDLPKSEVFASKSSAHRWLLRWQRDGTWQKILEKLIQIAAQKKLIDPDRLLVDGSFSPSRMGGADVEYGYKGKGSTIHLLTDGKGRPLGVKVTSAKGDERKQVMELIDSIRIINRRVNPILLEADKGYDSRELRLELLKNGIYPLIPYRGNRSHIASWIKRTRWKVERAISWMKRGYRRIATRWERLAEAYLGILLLAVCYFWIKKIVK